MKRIPPLLQSIARELFLVAIATIATAAQSKAVDVECRDSELDAVVLSRAISGSRSGDRILIHGTCVIARTIVLLGNRAYEGDSRSGTILRQAEGADLDVLLASSSWVNDARGCDAPVTVSHLTIDGARSTNPHTTGLLLRSWLTTVEDVRIQNVGGDGIAIASPSRSGAPLAGTEVNGLLADLFIDNVGGAGVRVIAPANAVTDWILRDSWIANTGHSGVDLDNAAGWQVRNLHLYSIGQHAIMARRCYATTLVSNYIENFGHTDSNGTFYGIACVLQGGAGSTIALNQVFMLGRISVPKRLVHLAVPSVNSGKGAVTIFGNIVRGAGLADEVGLVLSAPPKTSLKASYSGNSILDFARPQLTSGDVEFVP